MPERVATVFVFLFYAYASIGLLFALGFTYRGVQKIDPSAAGTGFFFRCLIFPGSVAFWPLLLRRWLRGRGEPPEQENPHR
jgi:hypothetical protein